MGAGAVWVAGALWTRARLMRACKLNVRVIMDLRYSLFAYD